MTVVMTFSNSNISITLDVVSGTVNGVAINTSYSVSCIDSSNNGDVSCTQNS